MLYFNRYFKDTAIGARVRSIEEDPEEGAGVGIEGFGIGDGVEVAGEIADEDAAAGEALGPFVEFGLKTAGALPGVHAPAAEFDLFAAFVNTGNLKGVGTVAQFLLKQFAGGGFERFGEMDEGLFMPFVVAQGNPLIGIRPGETAAVSGF